MLDKIKAGCYNTVIELCKIKIGNQGKIKKEEVDKEWKKDIKDTKRDFC